MKKWCLLLALCLLLTACGKAETAETDWTAVQMAEAIAAGQAGMENCHWLSTGDSDFPLYVSAVYQLDPALVEDGAVAAVGGTSAGEVAVLGFTDEAAAQAASKALEDYRKAREGDFTGYVPEEAAVAAGGKVVIRGRYAALLICADADAARDVFFACFGSAPPEKMTDGGADAPLPGPSAVQEPRPETEEPGTAPEQDADVGPAPAPDPDPAPEPAAGPDPAPPTDPAPAPAPDPAPDPGPDPEPAPSPEPAPAPDTGGETEPADTYDAAAVLSAWQSGDSAGLTEKNRAILEKCTEVIEERITGDMLPWEKELAIHDWMIDWAEYDPGELDQAWMEPNPDNDNPYGFLYGRVGICLGYARTFQLFMDMLDIPCVTVEGTAHAGTEDHAWNLVELDGEWYAVDTTWDDPVYDYTPSPETVRWYAHIYFNVTSDFLRRNDHQWDGDAVAEATGTRYAWQG